MQPKEIQVVRAVVGIGEYHLSAHFVLAGIEGYIDLVVGAILPLGRSRHTAGTAVLVAAGRIKQGTKGFAVIVSLLGTASYPAQCCKGKNDKLFHEAC